MKQCKVFVPYGALGNGIAKEAFARGLELGPDIISCDAGSTDSGPYYLGTGKGKYARKAVKEDLKRIILGARTLGIPITIGSCGTCGSNQGVDMMAELCREICAKEHLSLKVAKIYTEQSPEDIKRRYLEGEVTALPGAPQITEKTFDQCTTIVALAGAEAFQEALRQGADIVLCGRATDTAVIAAMPLMMGCNPASAWHGAKVAECGSVCTTNPRRGGVFMTFDEEGFTATATAPDGYCTVYSVSAHMLYENSDPYHLYEPGIMIDTSDSVYTQMDEKSVRCTGTKITYLPYTMKLEGSGPIGYQTISFVGIRDRRVMGDPMKWLARVQKAAEERLCTQNITEEYSYQLKPYGWNAVSGEVIEPGSYIPRELGVMLAVTAETQETATQIAKIFNPLLLHCPVAENEQMPSFAFPFSPAEIERGRIYEFKLHHVVALKDPLEIVKYMYDNIGGN